MLRILAVRLTLLYTLLFSLLALAAFGLVYYSLQKDLMLRVDMDMLGDGQEFVDFYQTQGLASLLPEVHLEAAGEAFDVFYRIYSPEQEIIEVSDLSAWSGLPERSALLNSPEKNRFETITLSGRSEHARLFYQDLGDGYILQVGTLLTQDEQLLGNFIRAALGAFVLLLVGGGGVGLLMARRALAGIETVRCSADRISRGDLTQPIPCNGGSVEVNNLVTSFNRMQERIQTLIRELQEVTNNVAHDLRSPVTRMRGLAETTLTGPQTLEEYRDLASAVVEESDRLVGMVNTMLEIAETDAGIRPPTGEAVDLVEIVGDVTDLYLTVAEDQEIVLETRGPYPSLIVPGDRSRLQRVVANLLDNALKFTPKGGQVTVTLGKDRDRALLTVADNGPGISAESMPRIFDRFFRGEQSRTTLGSGLGLSLVKSIVQAHGGQVEVDSVPGHSTRFIVSLPL